MRSESKLTNKEKKRKKKKGTNQNQSESLIFRIQNKG